jgi:hypothetical protein
MRTIVIILICISLIVPVLAQQADRYETAVQQKVRFAQLHIYLDSGNRALAAYQFELKATAGRPALAKADVKIVGVENGEHPAFKEPPYYDPAALANDRIIIAAFSTGKNLPKGRTRVTTIQLQIIGEVEPKYALELTVAGDANGNEIPAEITYEKGEQK